MFELQKLYKALITFLIDYHQYQRNTKKLEVKLPDKVEELACLSCTALDSALTKYINEATSSRSARKNLLDYTLRNILIIKEFMSSESITLKQVDSLNAQLCELLNNYIKLFLSDKPQLSIDGKLEKAETFKRRGGFAYSGTKIEELVLNPLGLNHNHRDSDVSLRINDLLKPITDNAKLNRYDAVQEAHEQRIDLLSAEVRQLKDEKTSLETQVSSLKEQLSTLNNRLQNVEMMLRIGSTKKPANEKSASFF